MIVAVPRQTCDDVGRRVHDHFARAPVDDDELSGLNHAAGVVKADDSRHIERAGEDRGVVRAAPGVGREAAHLRPVHLRGERRRQLIGDQHGRLVELAEEIARRRDALPQVHLHASDEVRDVAFPLPQVRIGDIVEDRAELVEDLLHGPLGVDALAADDLRGARDEHRVVEHEELRVEERRELGSAPPGDAAADVGELFARAGPALFEARDLVVDP